jgi:hypothetical protein
MLALPPYPGAKRACHECGKSFVLSDDQRCEARKGALRMFCSRQCYHTPKTGTTYRKVNGRHEHRTIAEQIVGRALRKGEVVHHKNGNKRDNRRSNLHVFASQAEHARFHKLKGKRK